MSRLIVNNYVIAVAAIAISLVPACNISPRSGTSGLKPGINYMQPLKWRMTYRYRVQEIEPEIPFPSERRSPSNPSVPFVGKGTYELWFVSPYQGDEIRDVRLVYANPPPTEVVNDKESGVTYYYYDLTPSNELPKELQLSMQWEFVSFERYTYWPGFEYGSYDESSTLYKQFTQLRAPIDSHPMMKVTSKECKKLANGDPMQTAMSCYNYIIQNFDYDHLQGAWIDYAGQAALHSASRTWSNKSGVCDEFATALCALMRTSGIPARPCVGIVHSMYTLDEGSLALVPGGHAWIEFYLPNMGWVPADPTWGQHSETIDPFFSIMGAARRIPTVDYYFGKHDPFRITWYKDWNLELKPAPKTPGAEPTQSWMFGCTERTSGIKKVHYGWKGVESMPVGSKGWIRSKSAAGRNFDLNLEVLGPAKDREIEGIIEEIKAEGNHYLRVPPPIGDWPL